MKLDIKKKLLNRSDRVKSVDLHPTLPWVLTALYGGTVMIYDYNSQTQVRSIEITNAPVRSAKFIARKQWIIVGSDDNMLRVFNYNTAEKIKTIDEHTDYIRNIAVHQSLPYVFSCSDDDTIRMFDWDKNWQKVNTFVDHDHYIMQLKINPKDAAMFASASLDKTIKIWTVGTTKSTANYTLIGHDAGINCLDFSSDVERPQLVSGSDDGLVKVWDYQTRQCLYTFDEGGHLESVASVAFHPDIPIIMSGGEDDVIHMWNSQTYKHINQMNFGLKRIWSISAVAESNAVAFGFDEGTIVIKIGKELPLATFSNGKVVWVKQNEVSTFNLKLLAGADEGSKDGEVLKPQNVKEMGICETFAQNVRFAPTGRFFAAIGDNDFVIYAYPKFQNTAFGQGGDLVWSTVNAAQQNTFAVRLENGSIDIYKNFEKIKSFKTETACDGIFGGRLLALRSKESVTFYDWDTFDVIRRIDLAQNLKNVFWSEDSTKVTLSLEDTFYLLEFDGAAVAQAIATGALQEEDMEDGLEEAFNFVDEYSETVQSGLWVSGDCFTFTNIRGSLSYLIGGKIMKLGNADKKHHILGYDGKQNRLYLVDKNLNIYAHRLLLSVMNFQACILNNDLQKAQSFLTSIPDSFYGKLAKFLEINNQKQMAFQLTPDLDHKFELAISLNHVDVAQGIAEEQQSTEKWRKVGDIALSRGQFTLAEECFEKSNDYNSLLLFYSSYGDQEGLQKLALQAEKHGKYNVAFEAYFLLAQVDNCINVLVKSKRMAEAAVFARAYAPSRLGEMTALWGGHLKEQGFPFQPDDISQTQLDHVNGEIEREMQMRAQLYDQPKQEASQIESVKQVSAQF